MLHELIKGLDYKETGDINQVRFCCPQCGDSKYHLYYYKNTNTGYCFKCATYFNAYKMAKFLKQFRLSHHFFVGDESEKEKRLVKIEDLSLHPVQDNKLAYGYLQSRMIGDDTIEKYHIQYCKSGKYKNRLIIPVYCCGRECGFIARSIFPNKILRTKVLYPSNMPISDVLFGHDDIGNEKQVILVEGVFDVIIPSQFCNVPCVASFGHKLSDAQLSLLINKGLYRLYIAYDGDSWNHIRNLANRVSPFFEEVVSIYLPKNEDPASLGSDFCRYLKSIF